MPVCSKRNYGRDPKSNKQTKNKKVHFYHTVSYSVDTCTAALQTDGRVKNHKLRSVGMDK